MNGKLITELRRLWSECRILVATGNAPIGLRAAIALAASDIEKLNAELDSLRAMLNCARKELAGGNIDSARLDWLESELCIEKVNLQQMYTPLFRRNIPITREDIDDAMRLTLDDTAYEELAKRKEQTT